MGKVLKLEVTPIGLSGISGKPVVLEFPEVVQGKQPSKF